MKKSFLIILIGSIFYFINNQYENEKNIWSVPESGAVYKNLFLLASIKYSLPKNLLARMAYQESRFRTDIITGEISSSAGAQGIMQIIPRWHPDVDPLNPVEAIPYAGQYIKKLYDRFGTWDKALAGYNIGPTAVSKLINNHGERWAAYLPSETKNYIKEILTDIKV